MKELNLQDYTYKSDILDNLTAKTSLCNDEMFETSSALEQGDTADQIAWDNVYGGYRPVDGADVTGDNTAANTLLVGDAAASTVAGWQYLSTVYINGGDIYSNTVTAAKINVAELSAISANIGTITAGTITGLTITGGTIQTSASANTGVKMTAAGGLDCYGQSLEFRDVTTGSYSGHIYGSNGVLIIGSLNKINLYSETMCGPIYPQTDGIYDLGTSTYEFRDLYIDGTAQVDALRIDQIPTSEVNTATHYATVNFDGTNYKVLLKSI